MNAHPGAAAPASGTEFPTLEQLAAKPEIAALLDFEPVPRMRQVEAGWTPDLQREFIARLAHYGSPGRACEEMGKNLTGMMKLYRSPLAASFRDAWHAAVELAKTRKARAAVEVRLAPGSKAPSIDHRRKSDPVEQVDEWADQADEERRMMESRDSITGKLRMARRLYLQEISDCPGKRAAFEILSGFAVDWDKARTLDEQPDEPWTIPNFRKADMLLTGENGWLGDIAHGPNKLDELRRALNDYLVTIGREPIAWETGTMPDWVGSESEERRMIESNSSKQRRG